MSTMPYHCTSNPMEDHTTEHSWSECFQDLASWCHLPQDELINATNVTNQSEFKDSFDDQSMYCWEANLSSVDLKGEGHTLKFPTNEENNSSSTPLMSETVKTNDATIRLSCKLLAPGVDQDTDTCHEMKTIDWNDMALSTTSCSTNYIPPKRTYNITPKTELTEINKPYSQLKLDINKASMRAPVSSEVIQTPEIIKSILESETDPFDLCNYLESTEDWNNMPVDPNTIVSQRPKETITIIHKVVTNDHDYTTEIPPINDLQTIKSENSFGIGNPTIPSLPLNMDEFEIKPFVKEEPSSPAPSTSTLLGKRVRKTMADEDYVYDEDPSSDNSVDWAPTQKKKSKTVKKKNEGSRKRNSSFSDSGSVTSGPDKYRELRDRNNEASRRSRMNRKQKEVEMIDKANYLQKQNALLKVKSEVLEKRVKSLRRILLEGVQKNSLIAR